MKITNIHECGASNLLKWAIANDADIASDASLISLINDETFYQITLTDVNFLELFRLTQAYREKVCVITEQKAEIPSDEELALYFPGKVHIEDTEFNASEIVSNACDMFMKLALQMHADDDIIQHNTAMLFLPMLCRKFDINIPISFGDLVATFDEQTPASNLFNTSYPDNLGDVVLNAPMICNKLMLYMIKSTSIIRYDDHFDTLLRLTKYAPLRKCPDDKLYKFRLCGLFKYNPISRDEVRCSFFNSNKVDMAESIKKLDTIKTPLNLDFVIQLPLHYMRILENSFSSNELRVSYEASISTIIDSGIVFNDFIAPEFDDSDEERMTEYNNAIELYRVRINDANKTVLGAIPLLLSNIDADYTASCAMLPAIYTTKAVITINMKYADLYLTHFDPLLRSMFQEMMEIAKSFNNQ